LRVLQVHLSYILTKSRCGLNRPVCRCGKEAARLFYGLSPYHTTTTLLFYVPARLLFYSALPFRYQYPSVVQGTRCLKKASPCSRVSSCATRSVCSFYLGLLPESTSASRLHAHCNLTFSTSFSCSFVSSCLADNELGNSTGRVDLSIIDSTVQLRNISQSS